MSDAPHVVRAEHPRSEDEQRQREDEADRHRASHGSCLVATEQRHQFAKCHCARERHRDVRRTTEAKSGKARLVVIGAANSVAHPRKARRSGTEEPDQHDRETAAPALLCLVPFVSEVRHADPTHRRSRSFHAPSATRMRRKMAHEREDSGMRVDVVPYDPEWPSQFEAVSGEMADALLGVAVIGIEHVGSTSVPGLAAKPVLDIDVVVALGDVADAIAALEVIGYTSLGEMGVPDRHALFGAGAPKRNVSVIVEGCLSLRNHRTLREVPRADPTLRDEYGDLKLALAQRELADIDEYVAAKSPIVQRILERGGLDQAERAEIAAINASER
jgi:GrpB-like predicted nucleotidyltransferase (UPF0157 family)